MALLDLESLPQVNRVFVGRTRELKLFEDAAHSIPDDRCSLLVFHGMGGRGKTWLCRKIRDICAEDASYGSHRVAHLDLAEKSEEKKRDDYWALVFIRNAFAREDVSTPCFDLALALTWETGRSEEPFPKLKNPWLGRVSGQVGDAMAEGAGDIKNWVSGETAGELLGEEVGKIPFIGTILTKSGKWAFNKAKLAYLHWSQSALQKLYADEKRTRLLPPDELRKLLPAMLAADLKQACAKGRKLVLLVDEYERVLPEGGAMSPALLESRFDAAVRSCLSFSDQLLGVFFSREPLPWAELEMWEPLLDGRQHVLGGLGRGEAEAHLQAIPIDDPLLRSAMLDGSRDDEDAKDTILPLLLELQVDHWAALNTRGEAPSPDDFNLEGASSTERLSAMVQRLERDFGAPLKATLNRLAFARRFDKACFRAMIEEHVTGLPLENFEHLSKLSFIRDLGGGWMALHGRIAESVRGLQSPEFAAETVGSLFRHFDLRAQTENNLTLTDAHVEALFEAQSYLHGIAPIEDYTNWLKARCDPIERAGRFSDGERLWRAAAEHYSGSNRDDATFATMLNNVAYFLVALGRYQETEDLYKLAISKSARRRSARIIHLWRRR